MVNNKKAYSKVLLLIIVLLAIIGTQSMAVTVSKVTGVKTNIVNNTTANVSWDKLTNATKYEIYLKAQGKSYESLGMTNRTSVTINNLNANITYYVKVRAYNGNTAGDFSNETKISNANVITTLGAVIGLRQNNVTENKASISWNRVTNATGYEVYIREQNGSYVNRGTTPNLYTTLNGLTSGKTYYVKVRAVRVENGKTTYGSFSNELKVTTTQNTTIPTVKVDKVLNLNVTPNASKTALKWNKVADAEGYEVYVNIPGRGYISIGKTKSTDVKIIGLESGKTYYIKVRAYRGTTYGEFSDEVKCAIQNETSTIGTVTNLVSTVTGTETKLTWDKVANASKYEVFINIPGRGYISLGTTSKDSVKVINLSKGVTYKIKVRAIGEINGITAYGDYSNEVTVLAK